LTKTESAKLKGFLGLCRRAGQVILGQDACVDAVRRNTAAVVLLDESSSESSQKRFRNTCTSHHVPLISVPEDMIAQALGKDGRMAAAIRQGTMAQKIIGLAAEKPMTDDPMNTENKHGNIAGVQA
jgi:ribosomal protein L7Ae-like RNA K-turn-binding protein